MPEEFLTFSIYGHDVIELKAFPVLEGEPMSKLGVYCLTRMYWREFLELYWMG